MKKKLIVSVLALLGLCACNGTQISTVSSSSDNPTSQNSSESSSSVAPAISVSNDKVSLNLQGEKEVEVTASLPSGVTGELEWTTSSEDVVTVIPNGTKAKLTAVAKGQATITVSLKGASNVTSATISVSVLSYRPWTTEEENAMKEHLHGIVLEPTEISDMKAKWDEAGQQITIEGGYVEGNQLAEYASLYTEEDGWYSVTERYNVELGTAYMFEKKVSTTDGDRYVRVFIYALSDGYDTLDSEGAFFITAYDPYVYEWPETIVANTVASFLSSVTVPKVESQHYYIGGDSVTAYFESTEKDGGYSTLLTTAGFTVTEIENGDHDYYRALSSDELLGLVYIYADGALEISFTYPLTQSWPSKALGNAMTYYSAQGAVKFDIPAFEGENLTFMFSDGYYNYDYKNKQDKYLDLTGKVTVMDSTSQLTDAYKTKLTATAGWTEIGEGSGKYQKKVGDSDDTFARIDVSYDDAKKYTTIDFYYVPRPDATKGWQADAVAAALGKYVTDTIPAYEGDIEGFEIDGVDIVVSLKEDADANQAKEDYIATLKNKGYTEEGSGYSLKYQSPNKQIQLTLSTSSWNGNKLNIRFAEMPSEWNEDRIKELLQGIGSSVQSIVKFTSENEYLCSYVKKSDTTIELYLSRKDKEAFTNDDLASYASQFEQSSDWTKTADNTFESSDKTTVKLTKKWYTNVSNDTLLLTITAPAQQ